MANLKDDTLKITIVGFLIFALLAVWYAYDRFSLKGQAERILKMDYKQKEKLGTEAVLPLCWFLDNKARDVGSADAINILTRLKDQRAIEPLAKILKDTSNDKNLRIQASESLRKIGGPNAANALYECISDPQIGIVCLGNLVELKDMRAPQFIIGHAATNGVHLLDPQMELLLLKYKELAIPFLKEKIILENKAENKRYYYSLIGEIIVDKNYAEYAAKRALNNMGQTESLSGKVLVIAASDKRLYRTDVLPIEMLPSSEDEVSIIVWLEGLKGKQLASYEHGGIAYQGIRHITIFNRATGAIYHTKDIYGNESAPPMLINKKEWVSEVPAEKVTEYIKSVF